MTGPLEEARLLVTRDLGPLAEAAGDLIAAAVAHRAWWLGEWPAGAEHLPCLLAQDVQEAVQASVDRLWPRCPEHPDHCLLVEPDLGPAPFWVCPRSGLPVAPVGRL